MSDIIERELTPPDPSIARGTHLSRGFLHALVSTVHGTDQNPEGQTAVFPADDEGYINTDLVVELLAEGWEPWHAEPADHEAGIAFARQVLGDPLADAIVAYEAGEDE